jgi:hypothetical protein
MEWPQNAYSQLTKRYLVPFIKYGTRKYIDNVGTNMLALKVDDLVLPVSITDVPRYDNSYVCSPYNHYITYAIEEIPRLGIERPIIRALLSRMIEVFGLHLKWLHLDKVAIVNNCLFSTNLYPELTYQQIQAITALMVSRYPDHAIMFRCISETITNKLKAALTRSGYQMVASRPIYVVDTRNDAYLKRNNVKRDLKLLQDSDYEEVMNDDLTAADIRRMTSLYSDLYLTKYTPCNPQYNERFFELAVREHVFDCHAFRNRDEILCFGLFFSVAEVTCGLVLGYDFDVPKKTGLFRIVMAVDLREAGRRREPLHWSSGSAEFKCLRGAVPDLEYHAVYHQHLPFHRSLPWKTVKILFNGMAERLVKRERSAQGIHG